MNADLQRTNDFAAKVPGAVNACLGAGWTATVGAEQRSGDAAVGTASATQTVTWVHPAGVVVAMTVDAWMMSYAGSKTLVLTVDRPR